MKKYNELQELRDKLAAYEAEVPALAAKTRRAEISALMNAETLNAIRTAVADYIESEGRDCCYEMDEHKINLATLAKLLGVPAHPQQAGYFDFSPYKSEKIK